MKYCNFEKPKVEVHSLKEQPPLFRGTCDNHDCKLIECLLNLPLLYEDRILLTMQNIANHQNNNGGLMQVAVRNLGTLYTIETVGGVDLVCIIRDQQLPDNERWKNWRIVIPHSLIDEVI